MYNGYKIRFVNGLLKEVRLLFLTLNAIFSKIQLHINSLSTIKVNVCKHNIVLCL